MIFVQTTLLYTVQYLLLSDVRFKTLILLRLITGFVVF